MRVSIRTYVVILVAISALFVFVAKTQGGEQPAMMSNPEPAARVLPQIVKSIELNKEFDLAGERLPIEQFDVHQRLDRELTSNAYRHGSTSLNMKKAGRYFPIIEPILAEYNVPDDMKYIAVAESDLMNATSPAGAKGLWQFMRAVGLEYGLEINNEVDERYHLDKSTVAACKHLNRYKKRFDSWTLATAAYNGGIGRISKSLDRQRAGTFYELNLNQETSRYVFRVVAIKEIMSNPRQFGFYLDPEDLYPPINDFYTVEVNTAIENLGDFANKHGISYRELKMYNPWLISGSLSNPKRKTYEVKIPYKNM